MTEAQAIEAIAKWLNIKPEQVKSYYLVHDCRPLHITDLLHLLGDKTPSQPEDNNIHKGE